VTSNAAATLTRGIACGELATTRAVVESENVSGVVEGSQICDTVVTHSERRQT
jgi:hypothetical protein